MAQQQESDHMSFGKRLKPPAFDAKAAETLAIQALTAILADDDLLPRFLSVTGSSGDDLRTRMNDPDFLGAVLDFVLEQDEIVHLVAQAAGVEPEMIGRARLKLPGGLVDWTP